MNIHVHGKSQITVTSTQVTEALFLKGTRIKDGIFQFSANIQGFYRHSAFIVYKRSPLLLVINGKIQKILHFQHLNIVLNNILVFFFKTNF